MINYHDIIIYYQSLTTLDYTTRRKRQDSKRMKLCAAFQILGHGYADAVNIIAAIVHACYHFITVDVFNSFLIHKLIAYLYQTSNTDRRCREWEA